MFNFTVKEFILGGGTGTPTFQFYKRGFELGGSSGPSWQDIILSGNGSLSLTNAKADGLNYLKLFGGTEQRNLPEGYTEYSGLIGDGDAYLDLNCAIDQNDEIEFEFTMPSTGITSKNIFGYRDSANSQAITAMIASSGSNTFISDFNNSNYTDYRLSFALSSSTRYRVVINKNGRYIYDSTGTLVASNTTACNDTITTGNVLLFGIGGSPAYTGSGSKFNGTIHRCLIKGKRDVVPAGNGTTYGMYDKLNGVFYSRANDSGSFSVGSAVTTPSPSQPIDIVSNNGVVKARHQSGLPLGYTLLDYVVFDSTQAIDTGFIPNNNSRIESKCYRTGGDCWFYGASPSNPRVTLYHSNTGTCRWGYQSRSNVGFVADTEYTIIEDKNGLTINGTLCPWNSGTADDFTCDRSLTIGNNNGSSGTRYFAGNFYYMKIYNNGVLARDFIPCKNASNVVGLYDRVNGVFYTDTGLIAGNPISDAIEIYTDGTVETVGVIGKNLFDAQNVEIQEGTAISADGSLVTNSAVNTCITYISVKPNTTYTISGNILGTSSAFFRLAQYKADKTFISRSEDSTGERSSYTFTTGANTYYIRFHYVKTASLNTYQLEQGSTATTYEPYYYGGQATAEMLLKVGTYQDVQSILDGEVTRNVGIKVMTGDETFQSGTNGWISEDTITNNLKDIYTPICTHFGGTDTTPVANSNTIRVYYTSQNVPRVYFGVDKTIYTSAEVFKQWLKDQYNAGFPVVIIYPLATATTESVTAQPLSIKAGTNIVEITQASINNLGLEVSYKGTV